MFTLSNTLLTISILDPAAADASRLGSRYCTGGYIWQIEHRTAGPLLTGPQFPSPTPLPFHGQGAPEAFVTPLGRDDAEVGETVTVIGVGEVLRTSCVSPFHVRDNPTVRTFCVWSVATGAGYICMSTEQQSGSYAVTLVRTVTLRENIVTSATEITNRSAVDLPVRWFPHPFFPPCPDGRCCSIDFLWDLPENPGYLKNDHGLLVRKMEYPREKGLFQKLEIPQDTILRAEVCHPVLHDISVITDYRLESLPVWGNDRTFSLEPYLSKTVAPGERLGWRIAYRF
jgi:hypothetical protein